MLTLARKKDWETIRSISVQIHDLHVKWRPDIYYHSEEPYPYKFLLEDIKDGLVYVAKLQNEVVGYVILSVVEKEGPGTVPAKQIRIDSICVDRDLRGKGIGKAMVWDVFEIAKSMGCSDVLLGVHPENADALAFYEKCGFTVRTIHMEKKL